MRNDAGEIGFRVIVGGGLGRTPIIGHVIREFLPRAELLNYLDAILRVYNRFGRRDNMYKARIKILVKELHARACSRATSRPSGSTLAAAPATRARRGDRAPRRALRAAAVRSAAGDDAGYRAAIADNRAFANWVEAQRASAQGAGLRRRHAVAQEDAACRRATRPPTRWTRSPTWPTATASASCACRTSRT